MGAPPRASLPRAPLPRTAVHRIACAVVAAETGRLCDTARPQPARGDWPAALPIGDAGLGLDSLERLGALAALAETFEIDDRMLPPEPPGTVGAWVDWIMRAQVEGGGRLTVRTSGSTGAARRCSHAVADLLDEAAFLATRFAGRRRVVALVPAQHLYGMIWTALLPAALGVPVVTRAIGTPLDLVAGDLVVAVPDQWRALLRLARHVPADVVGVSSAGTLDDDVAAGLRTAGLLRLIDIYGSSETGGIALRELPATAYDLLPRWELVAGDRDEAHGDAWRLVDRDGRVVPLPDHVERIGDRSLRPVGRRDGAVKVAGHNVWPARIATLLREVDGIADAAVRLQGNGRLKAFVVPHAGVDRVAVSARLARAIDTRLTAPERPADMRFGAQLPRNAMGKLEDWA